MATITSNKPAVAKALFGLSQTFNLRRKPRGGKKRVGDELIDTAAGAIEDRSVNKQLRPGGGHWAPLKESTKERKARLGLDPRINIETHEMLDLEQIRGRTVVTSAVAVMAAGLDEATQAKVEFAEEGGPNRPARPFYDLGDDGEKAVDTLCNEIRDQAVIDAENA